MGDAAPGATSSAASSAPTARRRTPRRTSSRPTRRWLPRVAPLCWAPGSRSGTASAGRSLLTDGLSPVNGCVLWTHNTHSITWDEVLMLPQQGARALGRPLADSGIVAAGRMARQARRFGWAALLALDLLLGAAVWLFHLTDYGLAGALSDLLFLLLVGLLGLLSLRLAPRLADGRARRAARLAALLPLSGGAFYVVALPFALAGIVLLPWASYRMAYAVEEMAAERPIQQTLSPGRTWLARVYFQPVGDNAGYRGHVWIRVAPPALPFLERRTYYLPVTRVADGQWQEYVTWLDDD